MAESKSVNGNVILDDERMKDAHAFCDMVLEKVAADSDLADMLMATLFNPEYRVGGIAEILHKVSLAAVASCCSGELYDRGMRELEADGARLEGAPVCHGCGGPLLADGTCAGRGVAPELGN